MGGCGYIGSALVPFLLADGHEVTVFDNQWFGTGDPAHNDNLRVVVADIRELDVYTKTSKGQDAVIWLAGLTNNDMCVSYPGLADFVNVGAFQQCFDATKVERFIYASSVAAYGSSPMLLREDLPLNPSTPYAMHKARCEAIAAGSIIVRSASVCGPAPNMRFDTTINKMVHDAVKTNTILVNGGQQFRCHIHMRDLIDFYVLLLKAPLRQVVGEAFNVVSQNQSVFESATIVSSITGANVIRRARSDDRSYLVSGDKADRVLGYSPMRTVAMAVRDIEAHMDSGSWKDSETNPNYQRMRHDL